MLHFGVRNSTPSSNEARQKLLTLKTKLMKIKVYARTLALVATLLFCSAAMAQVAVTGVVKDAAGEPVIGASILVVGTTNGTITDIDGNFNLNVAADATLQISYIGYKEEVVPVNGQTSLQVTLHEDAEVLDDVVVVGYGVVKKNDATGSVTAIKPDDMNKGLVTNAQDMLQGKIAGVNITNSGGAPGAGATIRIRGGSSLSASNDPLIVIDGLAMDNNGIQGVSNPLSMVNPNDIETLTVLKDASATAIYGSRASNGVIIITTKKGKAGSTPKFSYEGNVSLGALVDRMETLTGDELRAYAVARNHSKKQKTYLGTANTDWQDAIYRLAPGTDHTFSLTGGTKHMPYRASLGYTYQDGTIKTSNMQRVTAAVNLSPSFLDNHLSFNLNAKGMYIANTYTDGGGIIGSALAFDPTRPVYDDTHHEYGGYYQTESSVKDVFDDNWGYMTDTNVPQNPVAQLKNKDDKSKAGSFVGNLEADYKIHGFEDLRLHANFGADYSYGRQRTIISPYSYSNNYYGWDGVTKKTKYNLLFNAYAQYYKDFTETQHFDAMLGYEWQHFKNWGSTDGSGFYQKTYKDTSLAGKPYNLYTTEWASESYLVSFFGRLNYTGWNQFMLTATVRGDGSSRFAYRNSKGKNNQWGVFPSVALGWKIKETFFKDNNELSEWKLRLGYGITGQQDLGQGDYPALLLYTQSREHANYSLGEIKDGDYIYEGNYRPGAYNEDLTWERTTTYNAGMDLAFLNNRVSFSVDYYYRLTKDLISVIDVPAGMNFSNQVVSNIGSLSNQGVEFMLNATAINLKNFKWDIGFNATYNKNMIESLTSGTSKNYYVETGGISSGTGNTIQRHQEGYAANTFWVYRTKKNEQGYYEIVNQNGDKDKNGKDIIDENDLVAYHNPMAPVTLGLQSKMQFYGFDLSFSLRASIGNYVYNDVAAGRMSSLASPERSGGFTNIIKGTETIYAAVSGSETISASSNAYKMDIFVENASFLRIDNITLGYTFDKNPKINARLYATVSNPIVISGYSGLDPEVYGGIDNNIYPRSMSAIIGVSLNF